MSLNNEKPAVEIEKMLIANRNHLSFDEWCYFDIEGVFEWPSGATAYWFHRVDNEDVTLYVGDKEGHILSEEDLDGVSEGLAGLVRVAWANGASWIRLTTYSDILADVPESIDEDDEEDDSDEEEDAE